MRDGALKPVPERLVIELTAHRTLALREAIGRSPDVALTLLLIVNRRAKLTPYRRPRLKWWTAPVPTVAHRSAVV